MLCVCYRKRLLHEVSHRIHCYCSSHCYCSDPPKALEPKSAGGALWLSQQLFKRTHSRQFSGILSISDVVLPQIQRAMPMLLSSTQDLFLSGTTEFYWLVTCYILRYSYAVKSIKRKR